MSSHEHTIDENPHRRHPQLLRKTLILYANWFTNAVLYYGLSLNSNLAGSDYYLNYMVNGALEIPAYTLAILVLIRCGRRVPIAGSLAISGLCLLATPLVPPSAVMWVSVAGKFFVTISFASIYLWTSELFPTELRATGVGSSCFFSRLGGAAASWIAMLAAYHESLPVLVYGLTSLLCAVALLFLPETKGKSVPDTLEQSERARVRSAKEALLCLR